MWNKGNKKGCGLGDEIVSYMYDELAGADRERFESHLIGCTACTDEFAEIANARYSVFDWRKREFAALETPAIVIPYDRPIAHQDSVPFGAFATFGEMVRSWRLAFAAVFIAVAGISVFTLVYLSNPQQVTVSSVPAPKGPDVIENVADETKEVATTKLPIDAIKQVNYRSNTARPVKAHAVKSVVRTHSVLAGATVADQAAKSGVSKPPVLGNYEENEDKSLRLADLFDTEVGVR